LLLQLDIFCLKGSNDKILCNLTKFWTLEYFQKWFSDTNFSIEIPDIPGKFWTYGNFQLVELTKSEG